MFLGGGATNLRVPHHPGFPVKLGGVNELHAAFLIESRTRCHGWGCAVGNPGSFAFFAKGGIPRISIPTVAYPTLCKKRKGWGTRLFVVLPAVPNTNRGLIENLYVDPHRSRRHNRFFTLPARTWGWFLKSDATHNVCGVESFGALLAFELHRIALVQGLVSIFLDSGKVYEHILPGGTLDESVSFRSIEPLHHAIFLQAKSLSRLY